MDNPLVSERPAVMGRSEVSKLLRKLFYTLTKRQRTRSDYYGELLRQHPEIDLETLMNIR